jgi:hypothetical protein
MTAGIEGGIKNRGIQILRASIDNEIDAVPPPKGGNFRLIAGIDTHGRKSFAAAHPFGNLCGTIKTEIRYDQFFQPLAAGIGPGGQYRVCFTHRSGSQQ